MGRFPSGQRDQTVNLTSTTSVVRIHLCPPKRPSRFSPAWSFSIIVDSNHIPIFRRFGLPEAEGEYNATACAASEPRAEPESILCPPRKPPNQAVFRLFMGFIKVAETAKIGTKKYIFSQIKFPSKELPFEGLFSSKTPLTTY